MNDELDNLLKKLAFARRATGDLQRRDENFGRGTTQANAEPALQQKALLGLLDEIAITGEQITRAHHEWMATIGMISPLSTPEPSGPAARLALRTRTLETIGRASFISEQVG